MTAGRPAGGDPVDGRAFARWWGQLTPLRPRALWAGHLDLTHLDVPVRIARPQPLDPLHRLLLRAVEATTPTTLNGLDARLGLGLAPLFQWLHDLESAGLLRITEGAYSVTAAGNAALATSTYAPLGRERRRFTFADVPGGTPHFLPWRAPATRSMSTPPPDAPAPADARLVAECASRPADWKQTYGFPADVVGVEAADATLPAAEAWRRVAVARFERVPVALAVVAPDGAPERLVGFVVAGDILAVNQPALELGAGWDGPFPELVRQTDADDQRVVDIGDGWRLTGEGRLRRVVLAPDSLESTGGL